MRYHNVRFARASASSGGVMAALAALDAADLELGVRQCFDLRSERATTPSSVRSFFAVYRQYFRCFRDAAFRERRPVAWLNGRLFVRLGRLTRRGLETFTVSDFETEQELEDAFMSAAYIPFGTSVCPPYFRGRVALDAGLPDMTTRDRYLFGRSCASIWPPADTERDPEVSAAVEELAAVPDAAGEGSQGTRCVVVTFAQLESRVDPTGLVVVQGSSHGLRDFWASAAKMEAGFVEGYVSMASRIDRPPPAAGEPTPREVALSYLAKTLATQSDWKGARRYAKPTLRLECDPLPLVLALLALLLAAACALLRHGPGPLLELIAQA